MLFAIQQAWLKLCIILAYIEKMYVYHSWPASLSHCRTSSTVLKTEHPVQLLPATHYTGLQQKVTNI